MHFKRLRRLFISPISALCTAVQFMNIDLCMSHHQRKQLLVVIELDLGELTDFSILLCIPGYKDQAISSAFLCLCPLKNQSHFSWLLSNKKPSPALTLSSPSFPSKLTAPLLDNSSCASRTYKCQVVSLMSQEKVNCDCISLVAVKGNESR
jgi:hypothetical protein